MEIIYFLVPIGIIMLGVAIALFSWAVRSDQFEDLDREGRRILFDEDMIGESKKSESTISPTSAESSSTTSTSTSAVATTSTATDSQSTGQP